MNKVRPFCGVRYNEDLVGDLASVLCPPYDVISPAYQDLLYSRNPYNSVRLELAKDQPGDRPNRNRNSRAGSSFREWLRQGALITDQTPSYYLLNQRFSANGILKNRLGLFAAVGLSPFKDGTILPHEKTTKSPKQDRLSLIRNAQANLSPIMGLYRDPGQHLKAIFQAVMENHPLAAASFEDQEFLLWRIHEVHDMEQIRRLLEPLPLFLADGHHRYETAVKYQKLKQNQLSKEPHNERASDFTLMVLISMDDPGLQLLPYHRILINLPKLQRVQLQNQLYEFFTIEECLPREGRYDHNVLAESISRGEYSESSIGFTDFETMKTFLITPKPHHSVKENNPMASFSGWWLEQKILKPSLEDNLDNHVVYVHDRPDLQEHIANSQAQLAFFLPPVPLNLFESLVKHGYRLPPKSTYFHPKLPTGLLIHNLRH